MAPRFLAAAGGLSVLFATTAALAVEPEITSDTAAQFYEVRSPTGQTVLSRRRLTTTLGVGVYDLVDAPPNDPSAPSLSFRARMRYDADYGATGAEVDPSPGSYGQFVPGYDRGPVDLMYGYVEGRRFLKGWLGFKLGRQYVVDALGWWSFDGGLVKITTPYYFAVEGYGGLEQRGGMPLATQRYERDGIWRGDRSGYDPSLYPSFQPNDIAPAYGAAIESSGFTWLHGRLTYRRVYNTGTSSTSPFSNGLRTSTQYDGARISQERIGYAMDGTLPNIGGVKGGLVYDQYVGQISNVFASVDGYASKRVTVSADYDYLLPTFDGDSIWNFFMSMPMNDVGLRAAWDATDHLGVAGGGHARLFTLQTGPEDGLQSPTSPNGLSTANYYPSSKIEAAGGANLSGRYRFGEGSYGARALADFARSGDRLGADVFGERTVETRYVFQGRTGLWHWNDKLRPDRDAVGFQYVLGVGYKLFPRSLALAEFEHDINRIGGQRFRVMLWLQVAVTK